MRNVSCWPYAVTIETLPSALSSTRCANEVLLFYAAEYRFIYYELFCINNQIKNMNVIF